MLELNRLYYGKMEEMMLQLDDESVDVILTDPPYLYLKNQKLDKQFDEKLFFNEAKRVLKKSGFIILFGRGASFYRWNAMLDDLGFIFKEEFIWDKGYCTSPLTPISRVHETVSIFTKKDGKINKVKIPYLEMKKHNIDGIITDIKRLKTTFTNSKSLDAVRSFLENNIVPIDKDKVISTSISSIIKTQDRCASVMAGMQIGLNEKSIIRTDMQPPNNPRKGITSEPLKPTGDRCVNVMQSVEFGLNEKSIIKATRDHYSAIHPTQKPVRLLERLLALVLPKGVENPVVLDAFAGSASTLIAGINMSCNVIGFELDEEYFNAGNARFQSHLEAKKKEVIQTELF